MTCSIHRLTGSLFAVLLAFPCFLSGSEAIEVNGNVFIRSNDGSVKQLTSGGLDYDPSLSCDGKAVVFVRRAERKNNLAPDSELGEKDGSELWTVTVNVPASERRVFGGGAERAKWFGLFGPRFSANSGVVYFLRWFGNGYSLYALSLRTGDTTRLTDNPVPRIWTMCGDNGVVAEEDHLKMVGGHIYLYWLFDEGGRRRSLVGTSPADVEYYLGRSIPGNR